MIAERTGSLAGIKRHDYLPFGEELYMNTGGRTTPKDSAATTSTEVSPQKNEIVNGTGLLWGGYFGSGKADSLHPIHC